MDLVGAIRKLIPSTMRKRLKDNLGITALQAQVDRISELSGRNIQLETNVILLQERIDQLEERLWQSGAGPNDLEIAFGDIDNVEYEDGTLVIRGWMVDPVRDIDSIAIYINGEKVGEAERIERGDVTYYCRHLCNARNAGFAFRINRNIKEIEGTVDISAVSVRNGRELAKTELWYRTDLNSCLPVPPDHLLKRVGVTNRSWYMIFGMRTYREFWTSVLKHVDAGSINCMLDWGCGCGRVVGFFQMFSGIPVIYGCDIDSEAVEWCQENLGPAEFSVAPLYPPTSYPDDKFDLVIAHSVFTHLAQENQSRWLQEIQRILSPGGLFLATVLGKFATMIKFPGNKSKEILQTAIHDEIICEHADGVCPEDYYRYVYQTKAYTIREYSKYFDVLEYIEKGAAGRQDLIVMKKRM